MATPAAVLSILVKADGVARTQRDIRGLDNTLGRTGDRGDKAMRALKMGALGLAGGVVAAGVAAKKAFQEFENAQKVSRQTDAVIKSTGGSAKVTAKEIERLAGAISLKAGIDDEAIQSGSNLLLTFKNIRNETGKGNQVFNDATRIVTDMSVAMDQSLKSSAIQVGKALNDPVKGMSALSRVGVTFTEQQKAQVEALVASGDKLAAQKIILRELRSEFEGSAEAQATAGAKLQVAWENLSESVGGLLAPAIRDAQKKLAGFTRDLERIVGRKDLDFGEKLEAAFKQVRLNFGPMLRDANLGDRLAKLVEAATPKIADAAARAAPRTASAFVSGFLDAGPWGRLAAGGFLLAKFGGVGAFRSVGQRAGGQMATGIATSSGWRSAAASAGKGFGVAAAIAFLPEYIKRVQAGAAKSTPELDLPKSQRFLESAPLLGPVLGGLADDFMNADDKVGKLGQRIEETFRRFDKAADNRGLSALAQQARDAAKQFPDMSDEFLKAARIIEQRAAEVAPSVRGQFREMRRAGGANMRQMKETVAETMFDIKNKLGADSANGKEALAKNFRLAVGAIRQSMREGKIGTKEGLAEIERLMRESLKMFGITGEQATRYLNKQDTITGKTLPGGGSRTNAQRGAYISSGAPVGDTVPAMLERGEYVLNRKAVRAVGKGNLDRLNFGDAPRFQRGGSIGRMIAAANRLDAAQFPYLWGGGHQGSPAPFGPMDCSGAVSYVLQQGGVRIPTMVSGALATAGQPGPGKVTVYADAGHTLMRIGNRFFGTGAANPGGGAGWLPNPGAGYLSRFAVRHFDAAGLQAIKRVLFRGGLGAVSRLGQAGLDRVRSAANAKLDSLLTTPIGSGDAGDAGPGVGKQRLMSLWTQAGGPGRLANVAAAIALAESRGVVSARNPSGASGLWQILGQVVPGDIFDPLVNARNAVKKWRDAGGFSPWVQYTNGEYRQFLQRGGKVPGHGTGDKVPAMLEPGEFVIPRKAMQGFRKGGPVGWHANGAASGAQRAGGYWWQKNFLQAWLNGAMGIPRLNAAEKTATISDDLLAIQDILAVTEGFTETAMRAGDFGYADWLRGWRDQLSGFQSNLEQYGTRFEPPDLQAIGDNLFGGSLPSGPFGGLVGDAPAAVDAGRSVEDLIAVLEALRAEVAEQNAITSSTVAIGLREATRALADMVSGEIVGHGVVPRSALPSNGTVASY